MSSVGLSDTLFFFLKLYEIKMVLCIFGKTTVNYWQGALSQSLNRLLRTVEFPVSFHLQETVTFVDTDDVNCSQS